MKSPELIRHRISVSDYHLMIEAGILTEQDKVELIRGEIIQMSPKGSRHAACMGKISEWLIPRLVGQAMIRTQDPVHLSDHSEPEPDLVIVKSRSDFYVEAHPDAEDILLVIEVADTSLAVDRSTKSSLYAEAGIQEYWIVNLPEQVIEICKSPQGQRYKEIRIAEPGDVISVPGFNLEMPVEDWLI